MDLFNLAAKLTLDSSGFEHGVTSANDRGHKLASSLSKAFGKIKTAATAAISIAGVKKGIDTMLAFAGEVSNVGDKIDKQSQALGLSRKAYQEWDYILGQNGASIDSLGVSMKTLNSAILSASEGSAESTSAFAKLGVGIHELETMSLEDQFDAVVRAFQKMPAGAQKSALAVKLFGRNGMELLPLLNQSETSLDELRARAEELGIIMSEDAVDASVAYNDALDDLNRTFNGLKYSVGAKLLPAMTAAFGKITSYAGKISKAYQENGLKGVWDTLIADFKNIKWPTWDDVRTAIVTGWNGIQNGIHSLGVLAFGEKVDGTIDWPTWDDVKDAAGRAWNAIKEKAKNIAEGFGVLVFGRSEDGKVAWPDINQLVSDFNTWWDGTAVPAFNKAMVWTLSLFGLPTESAEFISSYVSGWWTTMKNGVQEVLQWALNPPEAPYQAGAKLHEIITNWWNGIKGSAQSLLQWVFGIPTPSDKDGTTTGALIKVWWDQNIVPKLKSALDFTLGLFGLPDAGTMKNEIVGWWISVKDMVGKLVLDIVPNILGLPTDTPSSVHESSGGMTHGGGGRGFAKGLNYVPFDNFMANLHRGEMVLSASQARRYREGGNGVDTADLASQIAGAVRSAMQDVTVRSYLSGRDITDNVNRDTIRQLKARRFAT